MLSNTNSDHRYSQTNSDHRYCHTNAQHRYSQTNSDHRYRYRYNLYSIVGANMKLKNDKYCMDKWNVYMVWKCMCESNEDVIKGVYASKRATWYEG